MPLSKPKFLSESKNRKSKSKNQNSNSIHITQEFKFNSNLITFIHHSGLSSFNYSKNPDPYRTEIQTKFNYSKITHLMTTPIFTMSVEYDHFRTRTLRYGLKINQIMYPHMVLLFPFFVLVFLLDELVRMEFNDPYLIILDKKT